MRAQHSERIEHVRFHGGPMDGQVRQFNTDMMPDVYSTPDRSATYRLRRTANPARTRRGWVDLHYEHMMREPSNDR